MGQQQSHWILMKYTALDKDSLYIIGKVFIAVGASFIGFILRWARPSYSVIFRNPQIPIIDAVHSLTVSASFPNFVGAAYLIAFIISYNLLMFPRHSLPIVCPSMPSIVVESQFGFSLTRASNLSRIIRSIVTRSRFDMRLFVAPCRYFSTSLFLKLSAMRLGGFNHLWGLSE